MSQQVVFAEYYAPEAIFKIPKGIDLKDKTKVEDWYVLHNTLCIKFVDKDKVQEIEASFETEEDYERPAKVSIVDRRECVCLSSDDDDEDDELFMIPCCHCGFRFERDTIMHDNAICDDDDNWFCQDCHEFCPKEESEEDED
jgi:hypothetical protein